MTLHHELLRAGDTTGSARVVQLVDRRVNELLHSISTPLPTRSAARRKIRDDRRSDERRSARLEWCAPGGNQDRGGVAEMLDGFGNGWRRQLRRLRQKRVCGEINAGADRAIIIVRIVAGLLNRRGSQRLRAASGDNTLSRRAMNAVEMNAVEMNVPERKQELQGQRGQRQTAAKSPVGANPTHQANTTLSCSGSCTPP